MEKVRKLEKERTAFDKRNCTKNRIRIIEVLKKESVLLRDRLNTITAGPHAQHELKVKY